MEAPEVQARRDVDASLVEAASTGGGEGLVVVVRVASPGVASEELRVSCQRHWAVQDLKAHLSVQHALQPAVSEQKLIYGGAVLADEEELAVVLRHPVADGGGHILLLVIPPPPVAGEGREEEGLRRRLPASSTPAPVAAAAVTPAAAADPASALQPADVHQLYASYFQHYLASLEQLGAEEPSQQQWLQALLASLPPDAVPEDTQPPVQPQQPAAPVEQPRRGGEEQGRGDWLDTALYVTMRLCFVYILVAHSASFTRLVIILLVGVAVYMYEAGMMPRPQRRGDRGEAALLRLMDNDDNNNVPRPNNNVMQPNDIPQPNANPAPPNVNHANAGAANAPANAQGVANVEQAPANNADVVGDAGVAPAVQEEVPARDLRSILSLSFTFVVALFTSLIPEQPDVI